MEDRFFWAVLLVVVAGISFSLGRVSVGRESGISIPISTQKIPVHTSSQVASVVATSSALAESVAASSSQTGAYVASKKGKKYHLPWCSGAKRITEENKVWFTDKATAEGAGYTPAENCPGI